MNTRDKIFCVKKRYLLKLKILVFAGPTGGTVCGVFTLSFPSISTRRIGKWST